MIIWQTVGLLGRVLSSPQGLYLNTGQHKHRINTYTYPTSMPCVGFEPTIPASERAKTVDALDRSATGTGFPIITPTDDSSSKCISTSLPTFLTILSLSLYIKSYIFLLWEYAEEELSIVFQKIPFVLWNYLRTDFLFQRSRKAYSHICIPLRRPLNLTGCS
jgi:hypothetical protein